MHLQVLHDSLQGCGIGETGARLIGDSLRGHPCLKTLKCVCFLVLVMVVSHHAVFLILAALDGTRLATVGRGLLQLQREPCRV